MDYWENIRVQAAISALQGVLEAKWGVVGEFLPEAAAAEAVALADALVKKLKESSTQVL